MMSSSAFENGVPACSGALGACVDVDVDVDAATDVGAAGSGGFAVDVNLH